MNETESEAYIFIYMKPIRKAIETIQIAIILIERERES